MAPPGARVAREWRGGKSLLKQLLKVPTTDNSALRTQIAALSDDLDSLRSQIDAAEARMDDLIAAAFGLTPDERAYMAADPRRSWS